jgi:predicted Zn-dependent protease
LRLTAAAWAIYDAACDTIPPQGCDTMPTINRFFLGKLVLAFALAAATLAGVHTLQASRIPAALLRQAERAADADKPDAAVRYLRQYLEFRPDDGDAQERLATLLRERPGRDPAELLLLYDKILRTDPTRHGTRREALALSLRAGRFADAETHAATLVAAFPGDAALLRQLAEAQAATQKPAEARKSYEDAVAADPADPLTYQFYARFLWEEVKNPAEATAVIDRLVKAMPHDAEAYLTRARAASRAAAAPDPAGDGQALTDLQRALDLDPENAEALRLLAEFYQLRRKPHEAHDCLARGVALYPGDLRLVRGLAWLDLNLGNVGAAVGVLEDGMAHAPDGFDLLVPLADLLVRLGDTARTAEIVKRLEARPTPTAKLQAKYLQSRLHMQAKRWGEAVELLTTLRLDAANLPGLESQVNLLLAACQQRRGDTAAERDTLKLLLNKDPNHLAGRVALAQAYLDAGMTAEATTEYETAVKSPFASPAVHATLVRLKALEYARAGSRPADWAQLDRIADELAKAAGPANSEPSLLRAEVAEASGDLKKATAILRAEASRRPGDVRVWAGLADRVARLAGVSAALGILDEAQAAAGDGADVRLARADLSARDPARLRPLAPLADSIGTWTDAEQTRLLLGLVEVYDRLGDEGAVLRTYRQAADRRPNDLALWEVFGERALRNPADPAAADLVRDAFAAARRLDPDGKSVAFLNAWRVAHAKETAGAAGAEDALTAAFTTTPERADVCLALAAVKRLRGDTAAATALIERATRLAPGIFPPTQHRLADLARRGDDAGLRAAVQRLAADPRWAGETLKRAIAGAAQLAPDHAAKLVAAAAPAVEREPGGLGWLGEQYAAAGRTSDAVDALTKAVDNPAATGDDWLRLALFAGRRGDRVAAIASLERAQSKLPPGLAAAVLVSYAETGLAPAGWTPEFATPESRTLYLRAALSVKLSRFQRPEAVAMLETAVKDATLPPADAAWAKRNLAMLLAAGGDAKERARAVELLTSAGDSIGETPDEMRATAAVLTALTRHLDGDARKVVSARAIKALDALVRVTGSARDAYLLAQVYRSAGDHKAAIEVLNALLDNDRTNLDYHLMALEELTDLGQMTAGVGFADRILALYPTDYRAISGVARFECKAGRPERALALSDAYVRTADATAGDLPAKSSRAAELLDELVRLPNVRSTPAGRAMTDAAVKRYEELAVTRPGAVAAAAGLLAEDGRHAEGFALVEKLAAGLSPRQRTAAGMAVLRAGGASERQFAVTQSWVEAARRAEPSATGPLADEAEFYALKLDYARAETLFAEVLAREPRNVVALNNLAWILAARPETSAKALELIDRAVGEVGVTAELLDTRARARIAARQFAMAEADLAEALTQGKTGLRLFHVALAKQGQTPPRPGDAATAFRQAKARGLDPKGVHPADLPAYRVMEAEATRGPS